MLRNPSSRIAQQHGLRDLIPICDALHSRAFGTEPNRDPKRPSSFPPQYPSKGPSRFPPPPARYPKAGQKVDFRHSRDGPKADLRQRTDKQRAVRYVAQPTETKHLLRPSELSERLKKLAAQGRLDDAVTMLKNAPLDAQNAIVWNTLLVLCMKERRFKLAYQMYTDMKRRGFTPTGRTFGTMLAGYSKIDDWRTHARQLEHVHMLFQNYKDWLEAQDLDSLDPRERLWLSSQFNSYIRILGDARMYQKMFDVYNLMDPNGPTAPDASTYASLLHALSERRALEGSENEGKTTTDIFLQNASDARLVWRQLLKHMEKAPDKLAPSSYVITGLLRCLTRGRPSDMLLAFDVIRDWCGLAKPGEDAPPTRVEMTPHISGAIFDLCNYHQKYRLAIHYLQCIMDQPLKQGETHPLDRQAVERVLHSYVYLASLGSMSEADQAMETLQWMLRQEIVNPNYAGRLRPSLDTYGIVLQTCWRGADWVSATRTFELLTGCSGKDFCDGQTDPPKIERRSAGKALQPNNTILSSMLRTAFASKDLANMRQCLRIVDFYKGEECLESVIALSQENLGFKEFVVEGNKEQDTISERIKSRHDKIWERFFGGKLAEAVIEVVDKVIPKRRPQLAAVTSETPEDSDSEPQDYIATEDERKRWLSLRSKAAKAIQCLKELKEIAPLRFVPRFETNPLGSERNRAWTDKQVEWDMTRRSMKSA
ncbi:hypothetical protein NM688_g495 [Phlebia brevispora]|uniref:Uncharacterized protein n=1 Tax=Phlebia brevispora TaxID=194682 RepID=A0ACC1TDV7_9APHY|nr:hypothetical protein NM688_g495 [Phlebia brevispora]